MRALIQRVASASVEIEGNIAGEIGKVFLILFGVTHTDTENDAVFLAEKCLNLRIFGAEMSLKLCSQGPVTIMLESR